MNKYPKFAQVEDRKYKINTNYKVALSCNKIAKSNVSGEERTKIKEEEFLNDLKKVNDTLGHEMGDIMILNFAKLLRKVVPLRYFVDRFGGDEFIVIAEDISGRLFRGTCPVCR